MTYDGHPSATATGRPCFSSDSASSLELRRSGGLSGSRQSYKQNEINSLEHCHARGLAPPLLLGFGTLPGPTFRLVRAFLLATLCIVSLACSCTHASALRSRLPGIALPLVLATLCIVSLTCSLHACCCPALACQALRCPFSWQLCALTASHVPCTHASTLRSRLPGIALPFLLATLCIDSFTCSLHACFCTPLSPARNCVAPCPGSFVHCQLDMFPARMLLHSAFACQELRCPLSWQLCALSA